MAMMRENLLGYSLQQLEEAMIGLGEPTYKGRQVFKWLYNTRQYDFGLMTDLSKDLRSRLAEKYTFEMLSLAKAAKSVDGTEKFLFTLSDGRPVESVLIPDDDRKTLCISSQSGCALACTFCATGTMGLLRNLAVGEILGQLLYVRERYGEDAFTNVVFMGMGEPLHNYSALIEALRIMSDPMGMKIAAKKITVSTSGITPKIIKLADSGLKARLALSLHAATQEKRAKIMPVAETFHLDKLMEAVRYYADTTGQRVTFEYILFDGFNDSYEDVKALARLIHGIPCKINILAYNPVPGLPYRRPSDEKVNWFGEQLMPKTPAVTVRQSRGRDIDAACGQLAAKALRN